MASACRSKEVSLLSCHAQYASPAITLVNKNFLLLCTTGGQCIDFLLKMMFLLGNLFLAGPIVFWLKSKFHKQVNVLLN